MHARSRGDPGAFPTTVPSSMPSSDDPTMVESLLSSARFEPYLRATGGDRQQAIALYQWNVAASAACFEAFHYVEIIVRNAMDRELGAYFEEETRRIPWFLLPVVSKAGSQAALERNIAEVRGRLRAQSQGRETREQIVAGLSFGFWAALLHSEYEDLWRRALHNSFPHSSGKRADVVALLETLRQFRNKLAHHDSLLGVDVRLMLDHMGRVLAWVDPTAGGWLANVERVSDLLIARPAGWRDTVVVGAREAWPLYLAIGAYVCQPGRSFRPVEHLAFYADREIKSEVPRVLYRVDHVDWTEGEVNRLRASGSTGDLRLADIIDAGRRSVWTGGRYQVFDLTRPGDAGHVTLNEPVPHTLKGRGTAFVQGQRYTSAAALRGAVSTADLG